MRLFLCFVVACSAGCRCCPPPKIPPAAVSQCESVIDATARVTPAAYKVEAVDVSVSMKYKW